MATIDNSNLSYTSRDYESILQELINTIPLLTKEWTSREETDPGIVLIKLMAMVGDMLSYNLDKQALELYPESVTQRKNAYQIYNLLGYKMHWYKSARCKATLFINGDTGNDIVLRRYSRFSSIDGNIYYTNPKDITIESGVQSIVIDLIQGIPKIPSTNTTSSTYNYSKLNDNWYDNYNYNLSSDDFIDNKYYLNDYSVDEDTIELCDDKGPWVLVEDIDLVDDTNKSYYNNRYFDFRVDEYDRPYIRLCSSWNENNNGSVQFKLFYIISSGSLGKVSSGVLKINNKYIANVYNEASSEGYDPETPKEAWINSRKWVNTNNTLITCNDFTKAVKRIEGVDNAIALDWMIDIQDPIETNMQNYEVRIYVIPNEDYLNTLNINRTEAIKELYETIDKYIKSNKILHLLCMTYWDKNASGDVDPSVTEIKTTNVIKHYKWQIEGILYYRTPLNKEDSDEIINVVNNTLKIKFGTSKINFNQSIKYIDVVNTILSCDSRILYVDLNPIKYKTSAIDEDGNLYLRDANEEELTGKHKIEIPPNGYYETINDEHIWNGPADSEPSAYDPELDVDNGYNPCIYEIVVNDYLPDTTPIKPSTVSIKIDTGNFTIYDDGNGKLVSGIVEGENTIIANSNGTIDYGRYTPVECETEEDLNNLTSNELRDGRIAIVGGQTYYKYSLNTDGTYSWKLTDDKPGLIKFELRYATASPIIISYKTNQLAIAEYENLNPEKFYASADSLKRKV